MNDDVSRQSEHAGAPDWDAIARYLAGESPSEEATRIARWLEAHPEDRELVEQLNASAAFDASADVDVEAALRQVHDRMNDAAPARPRLKVERGGAPRTRPLLISLALTAAAGIAAIAILKTRTESPVAPAAAATVYSTKTGQRDSVRLADGSRVILGPDSRLSVPSDFGTTVRTVALQGDAYFDVRHDAAKPFAVRVANAIVEDVGTTFTIDSDAGDATTVSVMSGVVRLRPVGSEANSGAVLSAGDRGTLTGGGSVTAQQQAVVAGDSAWTGGKLELRDASLTRVAGELRRWYGVRLGVADSSLRRRTVTTTFDVSQPVDEVLKKLSLMLGARVERQGDTATIHAGRGSNKVK